MARFFANIPTNLIIGFLGVGKTTAIRHLLEQVPEGERWGVLVNEFGEVGVDGALLDDDRTAVEEVFGGCLCCVTANGLQVGLNRLIRQYAPRRILIEPTGLGHPAQIIERLTTAPFDTVLDLRATIGLVDARHLREPRYRDHSLFQDQLFLADVLVANKSDLYGPEDDQAFEDLLFSMTPPKIRTARVSHGRIRPAWLDLHRNAGREALFPEAHAWLRQNPTQVDTAEQCVTPSHRADPWLRLESDAVDGYHGCGWVIDGGRRFDTAALDQLLNRLALARAKGVVHGYDGWVSFNKAGDDSEWRAAPGAERSRIELLDHEPRDWEALDTELRRLSTTTTAPGGH
ncbi:MAG: CobW family GTP-binding protein [Gammaproteobacteria bacterium]